MMTKFEIYATTTTIIIEIKKINLSIIHNNMMFDKIFAVEIIPEWIVFFQLSM